MDYKVYLKELNTSIKSIEGIYTSRLAINRLIDNDLDKVDFSFPNYIKSFLESGLRHKLSFSYNVHNKYAFGYCNMLFTEEMLIKKEQLIKQHSYFNTEFINKSRVFVFSELIFSHYVLIEVLPTYSVLWLLLPNGNTYKMNVTLEEYINFSLLTRGLYLGEAYLCPDFPENILKNQYDGFYENMESLFGVTSDQLPQCYHKQAVKDIVPVYIQYRKSLYEEFKIAFGAEIKAGTCSLSPSIETNYERIFPAPKVAAIEINTGLILPKAYRQLAYDFGYGDIKFSRTTKEGKYISIQFIKPLDVFRVNKTNEFNNDANLYLYGEKRKVPDFDGIRLFAISQEYKFGMHFLEEDNVEIVMIDSVENQRLVQMPKHIRTMDGFINRFLETKGEFLLNEIPL